MIDSFTLRQAGGDVPVATYYLRDVLKVDTLAGVLFTHWHDDHTEGARDLLASFPGGVQLVGLPGAYCQRDLATFAGSYIREETAFRPVRDILEVMEFLDRNPGVHRVKLGEQVRLSPKGAAWTVEALSPSVEDERRLLAAIAAVLPSVGGKSTRKLDTNEGCAVIRVEFAGLRIVVSSDLKAGNTSLVGWRHILAQNRGALRAHAVTVGHHGSKTAYLDEAWQEIGDPQRTLAISTLFPAKGAPLPLKQVLANVRKHARRVLLTGKIGGHVGSAVRVPRAELPFSSYSARHAGGEPGQVRLRYRAGLDRPSVELFPPAHEWK